jgi:hypothetical protein
MPATRTATKARKRGRPARRTNRSQLLPYPEFPLFPHASGRWAKKIRKQLHYFGRWDGPKGDTKWQAALEDYETKVHDLQAGRTPRANVDGLTVRALVNHFLTAKQHLVETAELSSRTFVDYHAVCARVVAVFGRERLVADLAADDFDLLRKELAKTLGLVAMGNAIQRVRVLFKHAYDYGLIDRPMRYGPTFKRPSRATVRKVKGANGQRMFEAAELRRIIGKASPQLSGRHTYRPYHGSLECQSYAF